MGIAAGRCRPVYKKRVTVPAIIDNNDNNNDKMIMIITTITTIIMTMTTMTPMTITITITISIIIIPIIIMPIIIIIIILNNNKNKTCIELIFKHGWERYVCFGNFKGDPDNICECRFSLTNWMTFSNIILTNNNLSVNKQGTPLISYFLDIVLGIFAVAFKRIWTVGSGRVV